MGVKWNALPLGRENLEHYLSSLLRGKVRVSDVRELTDEEQLKGFGYGVPLLIEFMCDGDAERFVLHTVSRDGFGHKRRSDRASNLLLDHAMFNNLPRHVRSRDVGALSEGGDLISLGRAGEFFQLTEYAEGKPYAADLPRISNEEELAAGDEEGIYEKAPIGEATTVPGLQVPYEPPENPTAVVDTESMSPQDGAHRIVMRLKELGFIEGQGGR